MITDFTGMTALVCGSTSGIGRAAAMQLAIANCSIILLGRSTERLSKTLKELPNNGKQDHSFVCIDLSVIENVNQQIGDLAGERQIDILVNNVGGPLPKPILECSTNDFLEVYYKQFLSFHQISLLLIENMKKNEFGRIINILGTSVKEPIPGLGLSAVKSITANWAKALSKEVGSYNITVNNILPGPTKTKELNEIIHLMSKFQNISFDTFSNRLIQDTALKRVAEPEEIANIIVFVASKYSSYLTGSNIVIDGGYSSSY